MSPGLHDDDRPARRLDEGARRARRLAIDPDALDWAGIAAFKRADGIYRERGYRTRLLAAAYRHRLHWTELVGGDVILTMPHALAGPLQRERHRSRAAHRRAGRPRPRAPTWSPGSRTSGGPTNPTASRSPSSTPTALRCARCAASSGRTTTSWAPCATSCCPTPTCGRHERACHDRSRRLQPGRPRRARDRRRGRASDRRSAAALAGAGARIAVVRTGRAETLDAAVQRVKGDRRRDALAVARGRDRRGRGRGRGRRTRSTTSARLDILVNAVGGGAGKVLHRRRGVPAPGLGLDHGAQPAQHARAHPGRSSGT